MMCQVIVLKGEVNPRNSHLSYSCLSGKKSIADVFYYFANPTLAYSFHESVNKASSQDDS